MSYAVSGFANRTLVRNMSSDETRNQQSMLREIDIVYPPYVSYLFHDDDFSFWGYMEKCTVSEGISVRFTKQHTLFGKRIPTARNEVKNIIEQNCEKNRPLAKIRAEKAARCRKIQDSGQKIDGLDICFNSVKIEHIF